MNKYLMKVVTKMYANPRLIINALVVEQAAEKHPLAPKTKAVKAPPRITKPPHPHLLLHPRPLPADPQSALPPEHRVRGPAARQKLDRKSAAGQAGIDLQLWAARFRGRGPVPE